MELSRLREELIAYQNAANIQDKNIYRHLLQLLKGENIKVHFENLREGKEGEMNGIELGRVILSTFGKRRSSSRLSYQANGLVLDAQDNWRVLVMPLLNPVYGIKPAFISNIINEKRGCTEPSIYPLINGTALNYYFYNGAWRLSSANSYDVGALYPEHRDEGSKTYNEIFNPLLMCPKGLDTNLSYTFLLSTPELHKLTHGPPVLYLCEVWDVKKGAFLVDLSDVSEALEVMDYRVLSVPVAAPGMVDEIINNNKEAKDKYVKLMVDGKIPTEIDTRFGYFVKYKYKGESCNAVIQSSLFSFIRNNFFNFPTPFRKDPAFYRRAERTYFIMLRLLQYKYNIDPFFKLFPEYKNTFDKIQNRVTELVDEIVRLLQNNTYEHLKATCTDETPISGLESTARAFLYEFLDDFKRQTGPQKKKASTGGKRIKHNVEDTLLYGNNIYGVFHYVCESIKG